jgi:hypothetical protein
LAVLFFAVNIISVANKVHRRASIFRLCRSTDLPRTPAASVLRLPSLTTAILAAFLGVLLTGAVAIQRDATPAQAQTCSWSGNWDSGNFGALHLSQDGTNINGGYAYTGSDGSSIVGQVIVYVVDNSTAAGAWQQSSNANPGGLGWTMAPDCNSFNG